MEVSRPRADEQIWWVDGEYHEVAERHGFMVKGQLPVAPLVLFAAGTSGGEVDVEFGCRNAAVHRVSWQGWEEYSGGGWWYAEKTLRGGEDVGLLEFEFGFPVWRVVLYPITCVALVAALMGYLLWRRNETLQRAAEDPAAAWFRYYVASQNVYLGGVAVIVFPSLLVNPGNFLGFVTGVDSPLVLRGVSLAVMLAPYVVLVGLAATVAHPVYSRVRGAQVMRKDLVLQGLFGTLMWTVPLCLVYVCVIALFEGMAVSAVLLGVCAAGSFLVLMNLWWKMFRVRRERLTECPLIERINSLAEKAGVKLKEIQILTPGTRLFSANAFSMQRARLVLTDFLVERLTSREVDAIVGHELAHARRKHPEKKVRFGLLGGVFLGVIAGFWTARIPTSGDLQWRLACLLGLGLWMILSRAVTRRYERQADADAVELTGDPEAFITGLTKVYKLNFWPVQWKKRAELIMNHPSLMRRVEPVAARAGITPENLESLVERAHTGDSYYAIPPSVLDEAKVFTSQVRRRILLVITLALRMLTAVPPALVALAVTRFEVQGAPRTVAYVAGVLLTLAGLIWGSGFLAMSGSRKLRSRLLAKLARQGFDLSGHNPAFVAFAPDDSAQAYEGFINTDVGFLFTAGDRLVFLGDSLKFALRRENLVSAELGHPTRGWQRWRRVLIRWQDSEGGSGMFCVYSYDVRHAAFITHANKRIIDSINAWQSGRQAVEVSEFGRLGLPENVAADGMLIQVPWRLVFRTCFPPVFLSLLLCIAFGIAGPNTAAGPPFYAIAATAVSHALHHLPYVKRPSEP
ncbi:MAG TPA: M48 family metalloprotease [Candidatus Bathyarchaeia archaeon]|nr:M48 family metalloprotease [Candidatus Bathyarchaeia archaeon]